MTGREIFSKIADFFGVDFIFGIVGREGEKIQFDELKGTEFVLVRHEQSSGIMAEVYSRFTEKPQMCFSTIGPGVTNMLTGIASSYKDRSPLIAVAVQVEEDHAHPDAHQYLDNVALAIPITNKTYSLSKLADVQELLRTGHKYLYEPLPGPIFLNIPICFLETEFDDHAVELMFSRAQNLELKPQVLNMVNEIEAIKTAFVHAKNPVVLLGGKANYGDFRKHLLAWSEKNNVLVGNTLAAKGAFPESHSNALGAVTVNTGVKLHVCTEMKLQIPVVKLEVNDSYL